MVPVGLFVVSVIAFMFVALSSSESWLSMIIMFALMCSACVASVVGFAFSAIAGASLYHLVSTPVEVVKILLWSSIAIQLYSVIQLWQYIKWRRLIPYLAGGFVTVGPFCWLVLHMSAGAYLLAIGLFIAAYGVYRLFSSPKAVQVSKRTGLFIDVATGAMGGITGPFAAFPGAAIAIWCCMRGWDKVEQRSVFQPYILIMQVVTLGIFTMMGGSSSLNFSYALFAVPAVFGCHIGLLLFKRLSNSQFNRLVSCFLIISGISMIAKMLGR
ncbi:MAG TPA: sulfite exporter TauE/SafE family protein [Rectinemataceae bacterium]|nr:sulfite exporter TauE/SafE family protein [Rectinemataceae bacterium]